MPPSYPEIKRIVEAAFAHRRKTLPNSLEPPGRAKDKSGRGPGRDRSRARTRAEASTPQEFVALAESLA